MSRALCGRRPRASRAAASLARRPASPRREPARARTATSGSEIGGAMADGSRCARGRPAARAPRSRCSSTGPFAMDDRQVHIGRLPGRAGLAVAVVTRPVDEEQARRRRRARRPAETPTSSEQSPAEHQWPLAGGDRRLRPRRRSPRRHSSRRPRATTPVRRRAGWAQRPRRVLASRGRRAARSDPPHRSAIWLAPRPPPPRGVAAPEEPSAREPGGLGASPVGERRSGARACRRGRRSGGRRRSSPRFRVSCPGVGGDVGQVLARAARPARTDRSARPNSSRLSK